MYIQVKDPEFALYSQGFKESLGKLSKLKVNKMQALIRGFLARKNGKLARYLHYKNDPKYLKLKMCIIALQTSDKQHYKKFMHALQIMVLLKEKS